MSYHNFSLKALLSDILLTAILLISPVISHAQVIAGTAAAGTSQITTITILSPNGGETKTLNFPLWVTWATTNFTSDKQVSVSLYGPYQGSVPLNQYNLGNVMNSGSYMFNLPPALSPGLYKVYISTIFPVGNPEQSASDLSNNFFTMGNFPVPTITSISPWSGSVGTSVTLVGTGFTSSNTVNLIPRSVGPIGQTNTSSANGSSIIFNIPSNLFTAGTYDVSVGNERGSSNTIPLTVTSQTPAITLLSPNGGETLIAGQSYAVKWAGNTDVLTLELLWGEKIISTYNAPLGSLLTLTIPTTITPGNYYKFRINGKGVSDESDNYFNIVFPAPTSLPDITVQTVSNNRTASSIIRNTDTINFNVGIKNNGGDITAPFTVAVIVSPDAQYTTGFKATDDVQGIRSGETKNVSITGSYLIPSGRDFSGTVTATADQLNGIIESDEKNNTLQQYMIAPALTQLTTTLLQQQISNVQSQLQSTTPGPTYDALKAQLATLQQQLASMTNGTSSSTPPPLAPNPTVDALQAQINSLMQQIALLQKQAGNQGISPTTPTAPTTPGSVSGQTPLADIDPNQGSSCTQLSYNMKLGSRDSWTNGEVTKLQGVLILKGYLNAEATGYFGYLTLKAVQAFQTASGFDSTGFVGPLTRAKIGAITCSR